MDTEAGLFNNILEYSESWSMFTIKSVVSGRKIDIRDAYLDTIEIAKKWTLSIRNWGKIRGELEIMYPDWMMI